MLLCYVIDSGLSTSLLLLATLIIMFYIYIYITLQIRFLRMNNLNPPRKVYAAGVKGLSLLVLWHP